MQTPSPGTGEGGARAAPAAWEGEGRRPVSLTDLMSRAKQMRLHPTEAEKRLWSMLRNGRIDGHRFKRQHILSPYIVDFVCLSAKLVVEADGSQHADNRDDVRRDTNLTRCGFRILRFWNNDVLARSDEVATAIHAALNDPHPPTAPRRAPPSPVPGEGQGDWNA